ncbi:hypothetical protein [Streptomyces ipomoeae]|uniref:hypothetical protein n=1 Tax=Streptomyces ipomoeae TaxID=103232 RepID=UPI0029BFDD00|nr:hypothetical protein [Streptomyces ipomoeae]
MSPAQPGAGPGAAPRPRPANLLFLLLALVVAAASLVLPAAGRADAISRTAQTLYTPPSDAPAPGSLYARGLRLRYNGSANGTLLATFEQYTNGIPVFPIYRSTDNGNSWSKISEVADTQNGWGMRWQPELFELPTAAPAAPASGGTSTRPRCRPSYSGFTPSSATQMVYSYRKNATSIGSATTGSATRQTVPAYSIVVVQLRPAR